MISVERINNFFYQDKKIWISLSVFCLILLAIPLVLWLAGFIYFAINKTNPFLVTIYSWWDTLQQYPYEKSTLFKCLGFSVFTIYLLPPFLLAIIINQKRELHGSARFAKNSEIKNAKLFSDNGIIVGKYQGKFLKFPGQQFVLLSAPTRSGKGVGIVIPNCLSYEESMVILDIKQENFNITAGYRKEVLKQDVYLFNPFAEDKNDKGNPTPRTHRYNPLSSINKGIFRVGDILAIGNAIWPSSGKDAFWNDNARNLFLAIVLYLCELYDRRDYEGSDSEVPNFPVSFGEVLRQSSGRGSGLPIKEYFSKEVEKYSEWLSGECKDAFSNFLSASDDVLASILSTFNAPLTIWRNPIVDAATSENDFDLRDVRKRKMTIYLGITPDHLPDAKILVNLIFSQLVNLNTKVMPQETKALPHGHKDKLICACLLLMDEFTSIGKIDIIAKAVSYIAGYNLRLLPIIQSISQLESVYGKEDAQTFVTNHAMQIIYAPREQKDANLYSEMLGYYTEKSSSTSRPKGIFKKGSGGLSESISDQKRALLLPQEIKELGLWKEIILLENTKPIICEKIKYFEDPVFTKRLINSPNIETMDINKFIRETRGEYIELSDADLDLERMCIKDPPFNAEMLELLLDSEAPLPPNEDCSDIEKEEFIHDSIMYLQRENQERERIETILENEKNAKFREIEGYGKNPSEILSNINDENQEDNEDDQTDSITEDDKYLLKEKAINMFENAS